MRWSQVKHEPMKRDNLSQGQRIIVAFYSFSLGVEAPPQAPAAFACICHHFQPIGTIQWGWSEDMHLVAKSSETGEIRWQTLQSVAGGWWEFVCRGLCSQSAHCFYMMLLASKYTNILYINILLDTLRMCLLVFESVFDVWVDSEGN